MNIPRRPMAGLQPRSWSTSQIPPLDPEPAATTTVEAHGVGANWQEPSRIPVPTVQTSTEMAVLRLLVFATVIIAFANLGFYAIEQWLTR